MESLRGKLTANHRIHLKLHLNHIEAIEHAIGLIDVELETLLAPYADAVERLKTIPGIAKTTAHVLIAEIGTEMGRFQNVGHLISWAGLCPRSDESAGKRRSTKTRKSALWLKDTLIEAAWGSIQQEGFLSQVSVSPTPVSTRAQKSDCRRRRLNPDRRLSHPPRWSLI